MYHYNVNGCEWLAAAKELMPLPFQPDAFDGGYELLHANESIAAIRELLGFESATARKEV